jgi:hypothetical protein
MKYYKILVNAAEKGLSSEYAGNTFDFTNACEKCFTGTVVKGKHILKEIRVAHAYPIFQTLNGDFFISSVLYNLLIDKGISIPYKQAVTPKGTILNHVQLFSEYTLPKALIPEGYVRYKDGCVYCERDRYSRGAWLSTIHKARQTVIKDICFIYPSEIRELLVKSDVFLTYECVGNSVIRDGVIKALPKPGIIISDRIKDAFTEFGIKNVSYWELQLI